MCGNDERILTERAVRCAVSKMQKNVPNSVGKWRIRGQCGNCFLRDKVAVGFLILWLSTRPSVVEEGQ